MAHVRVTDTTLRDGHQSLWATRMGIEDMVPIIEQMDNIGYHSVEVWGGATFDVCMRYLDENPWERLRTLKKGFKKTPLQMLLRGQSLLGYTHYPDDVVEAFINKSVENGIDIIRIFDALNDIRNLETAIRQAKKAGAHVQAAIVYTISPVHTMDHYVETAQKLVDMGADSLCIKDMAGLLLPFKSRELVKRIKETIQLPLQLHTHYIGGMAVGACLKGVEAGVDVIDAAALPLAFGASQPPIETLVRALEDTEYATNLDIHKLFDITRYFEELRKRLGYPRGVTRINDMQVFDHQVPGGMISNLVSQLEEQKATHRLEEVLDEIPKVRADLGYPPLVTPTSQIVGTQAVLNVLLGERYKIVPDEVKSYIRGMYGRAPGPLNPDVSKKILGDEKPIEGRPGDVIEPILEKCRRELAELNPSEEDVLSYALFPQVAKKFLEDRKLGRKRTIDNSVSESKEEMTMNLNDVKELIQLVGSTDITEVQLESGGAKLLIRKGNVFSVEGALPVQAVPMAAQDIKSAAELSSQAKTPADRVQESQNNPNLITITAPMVGTFYRSPAPEAPAFVEKGTKIKPGQGVCIIEAMKLMNEIEAEVSGTIVDILVDNAQAVEYGQPLFLVEKA